MTEQFRHGADVVTRFEQGRGKRMAERTRRRELDDARFAQRFA
jgi:hypothetical protein